MGVMHLWKLREWQFALLSGFLILCAWLLENGAFALSASVVYVLAYVIGGYYKAKEGIMDFLSERKLNVEILMIIAAIGAAAIGYWAEGALLIFIFSMSGALETYTLNKSEKELSSLMDLKPQEATVIDGNVETVIPVDKLNIGERILVKPGERIPADGKIVQGTSAVDEAALSGESIPLSKQKNDDVFAGTMNGSGSLQVKVTKRAEDTLFQKIIDLVQSAKAEKPPSHLFIERFESGYVKAILLFGVCMMFLPHYLLGWSWTETWYRAMVFLVVASPCALVASIMPAVLSAISNGARHGILVKGGVHLEKLAHVRAIAFDKTGTLTNGKPKVTNLLCRGNLPEEKLLQAAASIEKHSTHPLAEAIVKYATSRGVGTLHPPEHIWEKDGFGVEAVWENRNWRIGKKDFVDQETASFYPEETKAFTAEGKTIVYAADEEGIAAIFALQDTVRKDAIPLIEQCKKEKLHLVMLTGDQESTARAIAKQARITDVASNCLPRDKVEKLKSLQKQFGHVAMVGDGINDAPALATANTSIAMGQGTDAALETADIVLMKDELPSIHYAINLSRKMNRIVRQNIVFSVGVITLLLLSNFLQQLSLPLGVIGHEGSTLLVILNSLRLLKGKPTFT